MQESTLNEKRESIRNNYASQSALLWGPTIEQIALHKALGWIPQNLTSSQEQSQEKSPVPNSGHMAPPPRECSCFWAELASFHAQHTAPRWTRVSQAAQCTHNSYIVPMRDMASIAQTVTRRVTGRPGQKPL